MSNDDERKFREFLQRHLPPVARADVEPRRDLWPQVLRRLAQGARPAPWFDWALLGAAALLGALFPRTISVLLYHL
jgi:hypothetical protein